MANQQVKLWHNWSGSVHSSPRTIAQPECIEDVVALVKACGQAGEQIRVVGSGHSFTPLVQTNAVLVSLDHLQGIEQIDREHGTVTVLAGTKLQLLGDTLLKAGLAQENLGDIDVQSIAGAISTGTHGTGIQFGNLSTQVEQLTLVTANGELLECSLEQDPDLFRAAQISLGTLGIIVRVTLRVVPAKRLHYQVRREPLQQCMAQLETYKQDNTHFEFYWFPYTEYVQVKYLNETAKPVNAGGLWAAFNRVVVENGVYWLLSEGCRLMPRLCQTVSNISAQGIAPVNEVDYSHHIFASPRWVRFNEMEYNIPSEHFSAVFAEIRECISRQHFAVHFPIECRFVHADDIWLSPAYQRPSAYLAIHMYRGMPYQDYFDQIEAIFQRYQGRPHWGKMHSLTAEHFATLYPRWHDFQRIRATLDPNGLFLNPYLRQLFAVETTNLSSHV
jgi:FAD-linked oxidoreductase